MKWDALEEEPCSLARTVAVIGDRWSLMILRECFLRKRRFDAFQTSLGITRHLLADRLKKLVRFGVLRRIPYMEAPKRYEYILTQKGLDLYPIIMSIVHWGNVHWWTRAAGRCSTSTNHAASILTRSWSVRNAASRCWPRKFMFIPDQVRAKLYCRKFARKALVRPNLAVLRMPGPRTDGREPDGYA